MLLQYRRNDLGTNAGNVGGRGATAPQEPYALTDKYAQY